MTHKIHWFCHDGEDLYRDYDTVLAAMSDMGIFSVTPDGTGDFIVSAYHEEDCTVRLTRAQLLALAEELVYAAKKGAV